MNMAEHRKGWDTLAKLRAKPVPFVSAGRVEPSKELDQRCPEQNLHGAAPADADKQLKKMRSLDRSVRTALGSSWNPTRPSSSATTVTRRVIMSATVSLVQYHDYEAID